MKDSTKIIIGVATVIIAAPLAYTQLSGNKMRKVGFNSNSNIDAATGQSIGGEDKYNKTTKLRRPSEIIEETPETISVYATGFDDEGVMFWIPMPNFQFGPKVITASSCGYGGKGWFGIAVAIEMGSKEETVTTMDDGYYLYKIPYDENDEAGNPKLTLVPTPDARQPAAGGGWIECGWGGEAERRIKIPRQLYDKWMKEVLTLGRKTFRKNDCEEEIKDMTNAMTDIIESSGCDVGGFFGQGFADDVKDFQATGILFGEMSYFCPNEKTTNNLANVLMSQAGKDVREKVKAEKDCQKQ